MNLILIEPEELTHDNTARVAGPRLRHLREVLGLVKGSTLRLFVDGVIQIETTDPQFASGQVALLVDRSDVSWDDVIVTNP